MYTYYFAELLAKMFDFGAEMEKTIAQSQQKFNVY